MFIDETLGQDQHGAAARLGTKGTALAGACFTLYVEKVLAPTLAKGDVVILDNLGSHRGKAARRAIRQLGAHLLFLPPYSPDLNPIEQLFAKLKHFLRKDEPS